MENKMKKLMILAALGTAALFTACGDDSSSAPSESCEVTTTENSVSMEIVFGETTTTTWTIDGDSITVSYEGIEGQSPRTYAKGEATVESLKAEAEQTCVETKKMWEEMGL